MTTEILYLTTQFQRWLNLQVARHLEAQAAKFKPASPEGIGMSGCSGPEVDGLETVAGARYSHQGSVAPHSDKQTVQA